METPYQTACRLLGALDDLLIEESTLMRTMDYVEAVAVRERSGPLVGKLCELANDPAVLSLRPRVQLLQERWEQNYHFLDEQLRGLHGELNRVTHARVRLRRVLPAYLGGSIAASRFNTAA